MCTNVADLSLILFTLSIVSIRSFIPSSEGDDKMEYIGVIANVRKQNEK
jgi:hypothetical protein